ncbi:MAG: M1 family peptidase, partial [Saprospiraceae bacterium]|nr:M1 family peptidase [Saprospiraceae bacterium]
MSITILKSCCLSLAVFLLIEFVSAQAPNKFDQLGTMLPTPNQTRAASGAPGNAYWQQKADYVIDVTLDEAQQKLSGKETITYHNQSRDALTYLWLQVDQNEKAVGADGFTTETGKLDS